MLKMDFPIFDGTYARIWVDKCHTFFALYKIPDGVKVAAGTMYMTNNVAYWYQACKMNHVWHDWEQFRDAVISEFEGDTQRDKMRNYCF